MTKSLSKFTEGIFEQFTSLGLNLIQTEGELEFSFYVHGDVRATLEGKVRTGSSTYSSIIVWQVHHIEKIEVDEDGNTDATGVYYGDFDNLDLAILQLIKVITEVRRETLGN